MSMKKCPKCGELYSESFGGCPFCADDAAFRSSTAKPRAARRMAIAVICVVLLALVGVAAFLFGPALSNKTRPQAPSPATGDEIPMPEPEPEEEPEEEPELGQIVAQGTEAAPAAAEVGTILQLAVTGQVECTWTSSDETVAAINRSGVVTTRTAGTATITATTAGGQTATCQITVTEPVPPVEETPPAQTVIVPVTPPATTTPSQNELNYTGGNTANSTEQTTQAPADTGGFLPAENTTTTTTNDYGGFMPAGYE